MHQSFLELLVRHYCSARITDLWRHGFDWKRIRYCEIKKGIPKRKSGRIGNKSRPYLVNRLKIKDDCASVGNTTKRNVRIKKRRRLKIRRNSWRLSKEWNRWLRSIPGTSIVAWITPRKTEQRETQIPCHPSIFFPIFPPSSDVGFWIQRQDSANHWSAPLLHTSCSLLPVPLSSYLLGVAPCGQTTLFFCLFLPPLFYFIFFFLVEKDFNCFWCSTPPADLTFSTKYKRASPPPSLPNCSAPFQ